MAKDAESNAENLKISVRIRPMKTEEAARRYERALRSVDDNMVVLYEQVSKKLDALREKRKKEHQFVYDVVFGESATQSHVYQNTTKQLIPFVLKGYNATVFAYGPTGTGKTYTMVGTPQEPGIMVMALNDLFNLMKKGTEKFTVNMSYLEIYNEHIRDLLVSNSKTLDLREDNKTGVIQVTGLSQVSTTSTSEVMKLLQKGNQRRMCEATGANKTSSRSHALLQINIQMSSHDKSSMGEEVKTGRLFMIDLAGSERARMTQNVGMRQKEGAHINRSLLALGNVINALAEGGAKFVNFRDSKLTRLLKDALIGNCKTVMIAHVSPTNIHREETRNTLNYADRAKQITTKTRQNKVDVSYHISQYQKIISELKEEIVRLKDKLGESESAPNIGGSKHKPNNEKVEKLKLELVETFKEQMDLRKKLMEIDNSIVAMSTEFEKQNQVIQEYETEKKSKKKGRRVSTDSDDSADDSEEEPEEIMEAWEDLIYIHNEQNRYSEMKEAILKELDEKKMLSKELEEKLPKETNGYEQRELLELLCKVHELEIQQVEMASNAMLKEHELYRRDLLITRYERQRSICDEIITKQRNLLSEGNSYTHELEELYHLYTLESEFTNNMKKDTSNGDFGISRSNSVLSLRPDKLPPISTKENPEKLFKPGRKPSLSDDRRPGTPLSITSPLSTPNTSAPSTGNSGSSITALPPIRGASQQIQNQSVMEIKSSLRNGPTTIGLPNTRRRADRLSSWETSSNPSDILVLDSPRLAKKDGSKLRSLPVYAEKRRGSFPSLSVPANRRNRRPSSDGESSPLKRGRLGKRRRNNELPPRRGNSLTRVQNKKETRLSDPSRRAIRNSIRQRRSKSYEALAYPRHISLP